MSDLQVVLAITSLVSVSLGTLLLTERVARRVVRAWRIGRRKTY
jgi:hypothetical protein